MAGNRRVQHLSAASGKSNDFREPPTNGNFADWVSPDKIHVFQKMVAQLRVIVGTYDKVAEAAGVGHNTIYRLVNENRITIPMGKKLLAAYKKQRGLLT